MDTMQNDNEYFRSRPIVFNLHKTLLDSVKWLESQGSKRFNWIWLLHEWPKGVKLCLKIRLIVMNSWQYFEKMTTHFYICILTRVSEFTLYNEKWTLCSHPIFPLSFSIICSNINNPNLNVWKDINWWWTKSQNQTNASKYFIGRRCCLINS